MIARNDDEATRGGRRPRGGDQLQAEAAKSVKKGVRMRDGGPQPAIKLGAFSWCGGATKRTLRLVIMSITKS